MDDDPIPAMDDEGFPEPHDRTDGWRRSDCCFAKVAESVKDVKVNADVPLDPDDVRTDEEGVAAWRSVTFTCNSCGKECATWTNPVLARYVAADQGKEIEDDA